jgi:hypothetical protein
MDGKAQIQNHQEKPSHHCSVSKRVKAKFKLEMFPFFFESLEKNFPAPRTPLKFPQKNTPLTIMVSSFIVRNCMSAF